MKASRPAISDIPAMPAFAGQVLIGAHESVCRLPLADVAIGCPGAVMRELLRLCDGQTPLEQVRASMARRWEPPQVDALMTSLVAEGALIEGRELIAAHWPYLENPMRFGSGADAGIEPMLRDEAFAAASAHPRLKTLHRKPASFHGLLEGRATSKTFADADVPLQALVDMLWAGYGVTRCSHQPKTPADSTERLHRTVPTVGRASGSVVHYCNLRALPGLPRGHYQVVFRPDGSLGFAPLPGDLGLLYRAFGKPAYLMRAQGVVIIGGNFASLKRRYGNRAALLCAIEAGHILQNMYLAATHANVAVVEMCDFCEQPLREALSFREQELPLVSMLIGGAPSADQRRLFEELPALSFRWIDDPVPVAGVPLLHVAEASARVEGDPQGRVLAGYGRGREAREAAVKAMAEVHERLALSRPEGLVRARMSDLADVQDPRGIVAYAPAQHARPGFPFVPFDPRRAVWWKQGRHADTGREVHVPADCVYFGAAMRAFAGRGYRPHTAASTSGAAAHINPELALENAVLELIERHAFLSAWYACKAGPRLSASSIPAPLAAWIKAYARDGIEIVARDFSAAGGSLAPVMGVCARDKRSGHFLVSCAAHFDPEVALVSAFEEAESRFARWRQVEFGRIAAARVDAPEEHEHLYAHGRHARHVDFLMAPGKGVALPRAGQCGAANMAQLRVRLREAGLRLIALDLTSRPASVDSGASLLSIQRAVIPGLIPIQFGYGSDPLGLPAVTKALGRRAGTVLAGRRILFPHPFG